MAEIHIGSFIVNEMLLGLDISVIREIVRRPEVTPVHNTPDFVRGLMNLRGQIVTILDIGIRLGVAPREMEDNSRIIILKTFDEIRRLGIPLPTDERGNDSMLGLLVDSVQDVVVVDEDNLEPPPANIHDFCDGFIDQVIKMDDKLLLLLEASAICSL